MKVIHFGHSSENLYKIKLGFPKFREYFDEAVESDVKRLLEETDFNDPYTVIFLDMAHPQSEYALKELHRTGITKRSVVMIFCGGKDAQQQMLWGHEYGASETFVNGLLRPFMFPLFLLKERETRGLT